MHQALFFKDKAGFFSCAGVVGKRLSDCLDGDLSGACLVESDRVGAGIYDMKQASGCKARGYWLAGWAAGQ